MVRVSFSELERFVLGLPETTVGPSYGGAPALRVNKKMFARLRAEMAQDVDELTGAPYGDVLMVGVADLAEKDAVLSEPGDAFFTVSHYDGYPAVLVRLGLADPVEVRELLLDAWRRAAPRRAVRALDELPGGPPTP